MKFNRREIHEQSSPICESAPIHLNTMEKSPKAVIRKPGEGRAYKMGRVTAVFMADNEETGHASSISEWWLEPNTEGPPIHKHPASHLYYVVKGALTVFLEGKGWFEAEKGTHIYIPGGMIHGFENRSSEKVGFLMINTPAGFENDMPHITEYWRVGPVGDAIRRKAPPAQAEQGPQLTSV
mmetsp:Transcript_118691/g.343303  ORF Transcript_118691/g.343303 Transcript_118691/m.343303 type:complete len:181 (+) Transcript_118691:225-767(+)